MTPEGTVAGRIELEQQLRWPGKVVGSAQELPTPTSVVVVCSHEKEVGQRGLLENRNMKKQAVVAGRSSVTRRKTAALVAALAVDA